MLLIVSEIKQNKQSCKICRSMNIDWFNYYRSDSSRPFNYRKNRDSYHRIRADDQRRWSAGNYSWFINHKSTKTFK